MIEGGIPNPNCSKCKGTGEYYVALPDDIGSPNLVICECVEPKPDEGLREGDSQAINHIYLW